MCRLCVSLNRRACAGVVRAVGRDACSRPTNADEGSVRGGIGSYPKMHFLDWTRMLSLAEIVEDAVMGGKWIWKLNGLNHCRSMTRPTKNTHRGWHEPKNGA